VTTPPRAGVSWTDVQIEAGRLADRWRDEQLTGVSGVPRGGTVPAAMVATQLELRQLELPRPGCLVVDDLVDSGATARRFNGHRFDALFRKSWSPPEVAPNAYQVPGDAWVVFPWEMGTDDEHGPTDAVRRLLQHLGEDPTREGLVDTPARVVRALTEMTSGYQLDPAEVLERQFPDDYDEMVIVRGIDFHSLCEHHMLGFTGTATVAYVPAPGRGVVGLSKLARLVDLYARRLQVQERLTMQIADALEAHLQPLGVGVVVAARHSCMGCRGVRKPRAEMVTSAIRGVLRDKPEARAEFLSLARAGAQLGIDPGT
jgi:GTP cyclohydrolase I